MFKFAADYIHTLWNVWFLLAGAALAFNEISERFLGWSWYWPRHHRWRAAVAVLVIAQIGAYKQQQDISTQTLDRAMAAKSAAELETANMKARLVADGALHQAEARSKDTIIADKDRQIADLQSIHLRAAAPVDVRIRSESAPSIYPKYVLSDVMGNVSWENLTDWTSPDPAFREVEVDWTTLPLDVSAVAEIWLTVMRGGWGQVRIWNLNSGTVAAQGERVDAPQNKAVRQLLSVKRASGPERYILQLRGTEVTARGDLSFVRK